LLVVALVLPACRPPPQQPNPVILEEARRRTPTETIHQLVAARDARRYDNVEARVVPDRAAAVVATLRAVDEFATANLALVEYVRNEHGVEAGATLDCSEWINRMDIFSRFIDVVTERIEGETAVVAFMANGQLPLQHARLARRDGVWLYDPGPGYDERLPAAFQRMAADTRSMLEDLKSGSIPREGLTRAPLKLAEELRRRLADGVGLLPTPAAQEDPASGP
jgi:hypothetical protein